MSTSLITISDSLVDVLDKLSLQTYTLPISILDKQTIGMQVRHIIEHWQILIANYDTKMINYANRNRDKKIENNLELAIQLLKNLQRTSSKENCALSVVSLDEQTVFDSTFYREIDAITEHIIHHVAIIKMAILFVEPTFIFPANFGYAPATISYKNQCVQ
jgi:hypothetical protein